MIWYVHMNIHNMICTYNISYHMHIIHIIWYVHMNTHNIICTYKHTWHIWYDGIQITHIIYIYIIWCTDYTYHKHISYHIIYIYHIISYTYIPSYHIHIWRYMRGWYTDYTYHICFVSLYAIHIMCTICVCTLFYTSLSVSFSSFWISASTAFCWIAATLQSCENFSNVVVN